MPRRLLMKELASSRSTAGRFSAGPVKADFLPIPSTQQPPTRTGASCCRNSTLGCVGRHTQPAVRVVLMEDVFNEKGTFSAGLAKAS